MKRTNLIFAASLLVFSTFLSSCQKTEETSPYVESSIEDDQVTALYDDVLNEADEMTSSGASKSIAQNAAESTTSGSGTRTFVLSFSGDTTIKTITYANFINGNNLNGHVKNGKIIIKIIGGPLQAKFERTVTFDNFTIDDNKIEGKKKITKTAEHVFSVVLTGGKITFTDGTFYTRQFTRTRTWVEGYNTANIWDDVFTIEGSASGINRKGKEYTHTIVNALVIKNECRWIVEGTVDLTLNGKTATLDYGMGECDNDATLTVEGKSYAIKLKGKR